jgi:hypothetical protein
MFVYHLPAKPLGEFTVKILSELVLAEKVKACDVYHGEEMRDPDPQLTHETRLKNIIHKRYVCFQFQQECPVMLYVSAQLTYESNQQSDFD